METFLIIIIVSIALEYILNKFYNTYKAMSNNSCDGACSGCKQSNECSDITHIKE